MSHIVTIPMSEENYIALEDTFVDTPNSDASKFFFDQLKLACGDAKRSIRNKKTFVNRRQPDGQLKQEEFSLKDVDMSKYTLDSNKGWLPEGITAEENKPLDRKIGDSTMHYLRTFGQLTMIRHEQYNEAEEAYLKNKEAEMRESKTPEDQIENWKKIQDDIRKDRLAAVPTCIEEAIYGSINPMIQQRIEQHELSVFDKEDAEINKPKEEKTS